MTKKGFNLVSTIIFAIFILSVSFLIFSIFWENKTSGQKNQQIFNELVQNTKISAQNYSIKSTDFYNSFLKSVKNFNDYKEINLKIDGKLFYSYPKQNSLIVKSPFSADFLGKDGNKITLEVEFYKVKPYSVFYYAKITFLIVLITTIISLIFLIFAKAENINDEKIILEDFDEELSKLTDEKENPISKNENDSDFFNDYTKENPDFLNDENDENIENLELDEKINGNKIIDSDISEIENSNEEFFQEITDSKNNKNSEEDLQIEKISQDSISGENSKIEEDVSTFLDEQNYVPKNSEENFQTTENITFEEEKPVLEENSFSDLPSETDFRIQLEKKLSESSNDNNDLSVLILKVENLEKETETGKNFISILKEKTPDKAEIFNFKENSFSMILKDTMLDEAMVFADKLYETLTSSNENNLFKITIGLSSRTQRLISGDRLITEAFEAEKHADFASSPIIAFRVNPEKYKNFILTSTN